MKQEIWATMIRVLPPNLTAEQAAMVFRRSVNLTRRRLLDNGYKVREMRRYEPPVWISKANWNLANVDIARKYKISRERVRQVRKKLGRSFVEARGRKNGN